MAAGILSSGSSTILYMDSLTRTSPATTGLKVTPAFPGCSLMAMAIATATLAGGRIAPATRSWALRQILRSNGCSKGRNKTTITAGRLGKLGLLPSPSAYDNVSCAIGTVRQYRQC